MYIYLNRYHIMFILLGYGSMNIQELTYPYMNGMLEGVGWSLREKLEATEYILKYQCTSCVRSLMLLVLSQGQAELDQCMVFSLSRSGCVQVRLTGELLGRFCVGTTVQPVWNLKRTGYATSLSYFSTLVSFPSLPFSAFSLENCPVVLEYKHMTATCPKAPTGLGVL
jgi:hypothetical protein